MKEPATFAAAMSSCGHFCDQSEAVKNADV